VDVSGLIGADTEEELAVMATVDKVAFAEVTKVMGLAGAGGGAAAVVAENAEPLAGAVEEGGEGLVGALENGVCGVENLLSRQPTLPGLGESNPEPLGDRILQLEVELPRIQDDIAAIRDTFASAEPLMPNWTPGMRYVDSMFFDVSQALAEHLGIPFDEAWALLARIVGDNPETWPQFTP
jgi:hypothetical protein